MEKTEEGAMIRGGGVYVIEEEGDNVARGEIYGRVGVRGLFQLS